MFSPVQPGVRLERRADRFRMPKQDPARRTLERSGQFDGPENDEYFVGLKRKVHV